MGDFNDAIESLSPIDTVLISFPMKKEFPRNIEQNQTKITMRNQKLRIIPLSIVLDS